MASETGQAPNGNGSDRHGTERKTMNPGGRWDDWVRWLVGGIIAGLVAWGGVGSRLSAVEVRMTMGEERAAEDRKLVREALDSTRNELARLREQLIQEEAMNRAATATAAAATRTR